MFNDCSLFHILLYNKQPVNWRKSIIHLRIWLHLYIENGLFGYKRKNRISFSQFLSSKNQFLQDFRLSLSYLYYIHSPAINQKKMHYKFYYLDLAKFHILFSTFNLCHWNGCLYHFNLAPKLSRTIAFFANKIVFFHYNFQYPKWHQSKQQPISSHHRIKK